MSLMSPRASRVLKTCPSRASSGAVATGRRDFARAVAIAPGAIPWAVVPSMISVMLGPVVPLIWLSLSPAIGASTVAVASPVIFPIWLYLTASTRVVSSNGPSVLSPKMACPTKPSVGTCKRDHRVFRPLRHHPELGRGGWGKKSWTASRPPTSTRRWLTSPATWPATRSTTVPFASSVWWTIAATTAWLFAS